MRGLLPFATALGALAGCGEPPRAGGAPLAITETRPQPLPSDEVVDVFVVGGPERRDVLWVVDDADAAEVVRDELLRELPAFLEAFLDRGLDWHLGVVSTDATDPDESGRLLAALTEATPDPFDALADGLAAVGDPAPAEGLAAVRLAVETERHRANVGFFRDDAALEIVLVGDRPDRTPPGTFPEGGFLPWLAGVPAAERAVSVLGPDPDGLAAASGGVALPTADVGAALAEIGFASSGLAREFFLAAPPVLATVEVLVVLPEDVVVAFEADRWAYDPVRNSVRFVAFVPPRGAEVRVTYEPAHP